MILLICLWFEIDPMSNRVNQNILNFYSYQLCMLLRLKIGCFLRDERFKMLWWTFPFFHKFSDDFNSRHVLLYRIWGFLDGWFSGTNEVILCQKSLKIMTMRMMLMILKMTTRIIPVMFVSEGWQQLPVFNM